MAARRLPPELWLFSAAVFAFHALTNAGYGWFRDELYFIVCGRHPAWGYVDQPPLFPLLAAASAALSGTSAAVFRLPAALAHAALVLLTSALAVRFGAARFGALVAGVAAAISPTFLVAGHLFTMNSLEPLFWLALATIAAALIDGGDRRLWLLAGAVAGVGLLNKHSMAFDAACLGTGLLLTPARVHLRTRWAAAGAALAALIVAPHLAWQVRNGFPMLELLRNGQLHKNAPFSLLGFAGGQLLEEHPLNVLVWAPGLWFLFRSRYRPLGLGAVLLFALFAVMKAKVYYFAPAFPPLFAAGGAQLERWLERWPRARWAAPAGLLASSVPLAVIALPLLPPERLVAYQRAIHFTPPVMERRAVSPLAQHLADELPWEGMVAAVQRAYAGLAPEERAGVIILAFNYGDAGAIDVLGRERGLPPASCGHNSYSLWGPPPESRTVIVMGGDVEDHRRSCASVEEVARTPDDPLWLPYERDLPIYVCRGLKRSIQEIWPELRLYI